MSSGSLANISGVADARAGASGTLISATTSERLLKMAKRKSSKSKSSSASRKGGRSASRPRALGAVPVRVARVGRVVPVGRVTATRVVPRRVVPVGRVAVPRIMPAPRVMPVAPPVRRVPLRPPGMGMPPVAPMGMPPAPPLGPAPGMMPAGRGLPSMRTPMGGVPRAPLAPRSPFPRGPRRF
jgi:hypothetical protein